MTKLEWNADTAVNLCRANGIQMTPEKATLLLRFVELLTRWNAIHNLVSRRDMENIWERHILHCLSPLRYFDPFEGMKILDIGTGGGLPGIPLAILCPETEVTLIDSIRKKTDAVKEIVREMNLSNVSVLNGRVEDNAMRSRLSRSFDICVARAVAPLSDLLEWSAPLLRSSPLTVRQVPYRVTALRELQLPCVMALKGGDLTAELQEARTRFRNIRLEELTIEFEASGVDMTGKKIVIAHFWRVQESEKTKAIS